MYETTAEGMSGDLVRIRRRTQLRSGRDLERFRAESVLRFSQKEQILRQNPFREIGG
jgi:hypothetical protein